VIQPKAPDGSQASPVHTEERGSQTIKTVPNLLSTIRLLVSPALVGLAWANLPAWCLALMVVLLLSDWLDGRLATWLKQDTVFGARLDSIADATLYTCVALALVLLRFDIIRQEAVWIGMALASYVVSIAAGFIKFRRKPSYHNRLAKISWLFMLIAVVPVFMDWTVWPLRVAMVGVLLSNLDSIAITFVSPQWRANVPSVFHARRQRTDEGPGRPRPWS
jgi:CDP-diacylglycerol--glycerol-3-phosphate 3-phosphatidyltransferase